MQHCYFQKILSEKQLTSFCNWFSTLVYQPKTFWWYERLIAFTDNHVGSHALVLPSNKKPSQVQLEFFFLFLANLATHGYVSEAMSSCSLLSSNPGCIKGFTTRFQVVLGWPCCLPLSFGSGVGGCSLQSVVLSSCLHLPRPASCARNICPLLDCEDLQDHNYTTFNLPTCVGTKFPIFIDNSLNYSVAQVATFSCMIAIKVLIQLSLSLDARTVIQPSNHCSTHT